jgi:hypothetical protein
MKDPQDRAEESFRLGKIGRSTQQKKRMHIPEELSKMHSSYASYSPGCIGYVRKFSGLPSSGNPAVLSNQDP